MRAYWNRPPAFIIFSTSPSGRKEYSFPVVVFFRVFVSWFTCASSPVLNSSHILCGHSQGRIWPVEMQFLKNILAKEFAITAFTPEAPKAMGACSLEDPQPKFFPAIIIG